MQEVATEDQLTVLTNGFMISQRKDQEFPMRPPTPTSPVQENLLKDSVQKSTQLASLSMWLELAEVFPEKEDLALVLVSTPMRLLPSMDQSAERML